MTSYENAIIEEIRKRLKGADACYTDIAKATGLCAPTISGIVKGTTRKPQATTLYKVAKAVGMTDAEIKEIYEHANAQQG